MNKQQIWKKIIPILFVTLIIVWGMAYEPKTAYEKCLQQEIESYDSPRLLMPNPLHLAMEECKEAREPTTVIMQ